MPAPSSLSIATSSLQRLVKEEASYHKELEQQAARIQKLEAGGDDENAEYLLKQERRAVEETKAVFPQLNQKITDAIAKLESQLEANKEDSSEAATTEVTKAKDVIAQAKKALRETL